jgi:hypothetical protein
MNGRALAPSTAAAVPLPRYTGEDRGRRRPLILLRKAEEGDHGESHGGGGPAMARGAAA